jgi:hypothetical protein
MLCLPLLSPEFLQLIAMGVILTSVMSFDFDSEYYMTLNITEYYLRTLAHSISHNKFVLENNK